MTVDEPFGRPRPGGRLSALARCAAIPRVTFASEHWGRRPLLSAASELPAGFTDLLTAGDVDDLLTERGLRTPYLRLVREGKPVPVDAYTTTGTVGSRRLTDLADADGVARAYAEGATIVLNSLHRIWPPLRRFCRQLAAELGHPTQANAYITPPGSRGFALHHDTHDVFVLQVDGAKRWSVHEPVLPLPLPSQTSAALADRRGGLVPQGPPVLSPVLTPGDALYLPKGYLHSAQTTADRSIHLTVGVLSTTWYDVLEDLMASAKDTLAFRTPLPLAAEGGPDDASDQAAVMLTTVAGWLGEVPVERVQAAIRRRRARSIPAEPVPALRQTDLAGHLAPATPVRLRHGLTLALAQDADTDAGSERIVLSLPDRVIAMPALVRPALECILTGARVTAQTLVDAYADPGTGLAWDATDGLVLIRRLLREGVVTAAEGPA